MVQKGRDEKIAFIIELARLEGASAEHLHYLRRGQGKVLTNLLPSDNDLQLAVYRAALGLMPESEDCRAIENALNLEQDLSDSLEQRRVDFLATTEDKATTRTLIRRERRGAEILVDYLDIMATTVGRDSVPELIKLRTKRRAVEAQRRLILKRLEEAGIDLAATKKDVTQNRPSRA